MRKIYSNYKIFGGFGLLLVLNIFSGILTFKLLKSPNHGYENVDLINDCNSLLAYSFVIGLNLLFLILIATQCKFVIIDQSSITFINPIIPFLRKTNMWTDFDFYILVDEDSRYNKYEAVWLIKDEKIMGRFSSFYYKNYQDLKKSIKTKGYGKKNYNQFAQFFALLGLKKIKK